MPRKKLREALEKLEHYLQVSQAGLDLIDLMTTFDIALADPKVVDDLVKSEADQRHVTAINQQLIENIAYTFIFIANDAFSKLNFEKNKTNFI